MTYNSIDNECKKMMNIIQGINSNIEIDYSKLYKFNSHLQKFNELVYHRSKESDDYIAYYNEMFRNIFESVHLGILGKKIPAMHMIRSTIELYGKLQITRQKLRVDDKFSQNMDIFIKENKKGKKKTKKIIVESKEELISIYHYFCDYVHTKNVENIQVFEVMEEILNKKPNNTIFSEVIDELTLVLHKMISIDVLANCTKYFESMATTVLYDYKTEFLSKQELAYFVEVTGK